MTIVLPVSTPDKERLEKSDAFVLYHEKKPYAIMREPEFFAHRKDERVCRQWGTNHPNHPYIKVIRGTKRGYNKQWEVERSHYRSE